MLFENKVTPALGGDSFQEYGVLDRARRVLEYVINLGDATKTALTEQAIWVATSVHLEQKPRPDGEPYLGHVFRVAERIALEYGSTSVEVILAAILHDTVEDQPEALINMLDVSTLSTTRSQREHALKCIAHAFGDEVSSLVGSLTNPSGEYSTTEEKNAAYVAHIAEIIQDPRVALIKLADFSDNGLRLHLVKDPARREKLSRKYLPVVTLFKERIASIDNTLLAEENKRTILQRLEKAEGEIKAYLLNPQKI